MLACALAAPALAASLSVAPPRHGGDGLAALEAEAALLADPRSAVPEALGLVGRHVPSSAALRQVGVESPSGEIVVSRQVYVASIVSYILLWSTFVAFVAFLYQKAKVAPTVDPERGYTDFTKFSSGPFDCLQDPKICIWSFLCPCIRFADSVSMLGILGFWPALALMAGAWLMNSLSGGLLIWAASALVWMVFRQKFRRSFSMDGQGDWKGYAGDCLLYFACAPCAIAQEARHVELAARADHEAVKIPLQPPPQAQPEP